MRRRHRWARSPGEPGRPGLAPLATTGPFPPAHVAAPTAAELMDRMPLGRCGPGPGEARVPGTVETSVVPHAPHTGGLDQEPEGRQRRVVSFLHGTLGWRP